MKKSVAKKRPMSPKQVAHLKRMHAALRKKKPAAAKKPAPRARKPAAAKPTPPPPPLRGVPHADFDPIVDHPGQTMLPLHTPGEEML